MTRNGRSCSQLWEIKDGNGSERSYGALSQAVDDLSQQAAEIWCRLVCHGHEDPAPYGEDWEPH